MKINHLVISICLSLGLVACSQPLITKSSDTAATSENADIETQIKRIEKKMKTKPDVKGWLLIGDAKMHLKQYDDAVWAYREAYVLSNYADEARSKLKRAMYHAGLVTDEERWVLEDQ